MQMRIDLEKEHMALRAEAEATARENDELRDRAARREAVKPAGLLELQDQLEMADEVRVTLCADIAKLTEELVTVKLQRAVDETDKEALRQRLRASTEKQRQLAVRMTELEVELSERDESGAETEEAIAGAFREVMQLQEKKVRELEAALAEARQGGRASTGMLNGIAGLSRGRPKSLWGLG
jgi:chromosome segregation ATPase